MTAPGPSPSTKLSTSFCGQIGNVIIFHDALTPQYVSELFKQGEQYIPDPQHSHE